MPITPGTDINQNILIENGSLHPSGRPIYIENCEFPRGWLSTQTKKGLADLMTVGSLNDMIQHPAADGSPCFCAPYNGKYMFRVRSTGVNWGTVHFWHSLTLLANRRLGIEVFFAFPYSADNLANYLQAFNIGFQEMVGGTDWYIGYVRYVPNAVNPRVELHYTTGMASPTILDLSTEPGHGPGSNKSLIWQNAKLIVDLNTHRFVKLYWNNHTIDLSAYPIWSEPLVGYANGIIPLFILEDVGPANRATMYIGGVITTQEEP
jgi:hypothetical protein